MPAYSPEVPGAEAFWHTILADGTIVDDPVKQHHEFASGRHGVKVDMDNIDESSNLFDNWIDILAIRTMQLAEIHNVGRLALVSVANGTNRVVPRVYDKVRTKVNSFYALTGKISDSAVALQPAAAQTMASELPDFAVVYEDVATSGLTSSSAVKAIRRVGVERLTVLNTVQRHDRLPRLDNIKAEYEWIVRENLPEYLPDDCRHHGFCAQGSRFIPKERK